jgi:hypothetical protein
MEASAEFHSPFAVYMWKGAGSQRVGGYMALGTVCTFAMANKQNTSNARIT